MNHEQIIRAWKDSSYRSSLSDEELAQLPAHPAGETLSEAELDSITGGHSKYTMDAFSYGVNGNVCSPVTVGTSGLYGQDFVVGGNFNFSPNCSTNYNFNTTTITNNVGNFTF